MSPRTLSIIKAREAGRAGKPCPVAKGDFSPEGLMLFQEWLAAATAQETGADILPEYAESEHPDLQLCRAKKDAAL